MKKTILQWLMIGITTAAAFVMADHAEAKSFPEIKAEQLKERLDAGEEVILLNPLSRIEYDDKHIPGSVNIPLQTILVSEKLPKDKDHLIVTYCLGRK